MFFSKFFKLLIVSFLIYGGNSIAAYNLYDIDIDQYYNINTSEAVDMSEFDPSVPYEDIYSGEEILRMQQKYDYIDKMCFSDASKQDMDFIREKLEIAQLFSIFMKTASFEFLFTTGRYCSVSNLITIYRTDWIQLSELFSTANKLIRQTMIKHHRMVLYKAMTEHRPYNDIKVWRSLLEAWQNSGK